MTEPLRIGIAGLGTVGVGVLRMLAEHQARVNKVVHRPVVITGVCARNRDRDRGIDISELTWFDSAVELAASPDIDVYVELIGGEDGDALASVEAALKAGKHVVTANKALLAHHGSALANLAEVQKVALKFEAAIAGGIPVVKVLRESLAANAVQRVYGILNGTCNYILTAMRNEGRPFDDILADAQAAGYAEADPTFDIGGWDAAHKLSLLTSIAFGTQLAFSDVYVEGIESISLTDIEAADDLGFRIKLLGVALKTDSGIEQRVHPALVPKDTSIAEVNGVTNCVAIDADNAGNILLVGPGAGAGPTASSVVSDIIDVANGDRSPAFVTPTSDQIPYVRARMRAHEGGYYIRMSVLDRPGAFASIAQRMADQQVSLKSIVQRELTGEPEQADGAAMEAARTVVMVTHETTEQSVRAALDAVESDGHVQGRPQMIRIEKLLFG